MEEDEQLDDEEDTMKAYFEKSAVFKRFKAEEDKELTQVDQCSATEDELNTLTKQYEELQQKVDNLDKKVKTDDRAIKSLSE